MLKFKVSTLVELCQQLTKSERLNIYVMLTRLIHFVLTLFVSTVITKQVFLTIKHVKTAFRNKMEDDFLVHCLTFYIKGDFVNNINVDSIINKFYASKPCRTQFR